MSLNDNNHITLDLSVHRIVNVRCVQNDLNSRKLFITLSNNGKPYDIGSGTKIRYKLCKADNKYIYNDITSITDDGEIFIDLTDQATSYIGVAHSELQLMDTDKDQVISSMPFNIIVGKSVISNTAIESKDEFNALNHLMDRSEHIITAGDKFTAELPKWETAELDRTNSEANRKQSEIVRISNETARVANENTRKTSETERIKNEGNREKITGEAITEMGNAIDRATIISEKCEDLYNTQPFINTNQKGAANGVAELDKNGLLLTSQVPGAYDDVMEGTATGISTDQETGSKTATGFILTGKTSACKPESGKIYIDTSTNIQYRWSGTIFVTTGSNIALGETSQTAGRGDWGKAAYQHSLLKDGSNPHNTKYVDSSGNAAKLATARSINDTPFDGTASIRTKNAWNVSLGASNSNTESWVVFAKTSQTNPDNNVGATLLITDCGNIAHQYTGVWLLQITNRGSKPFIGVTQLLDVGKRETAPVEFGYYTDNTNNKFCFGVHCGVWRSDCNITVLRNTGVEIGKFDTLSGAPYGWTTSAPRILQDVPLSNALNVSEAGKNSLDAVQANPFIKGSLANKIKPEIFKVISSEEKKDNPSGWYRILTRKASYADAIGATPYFIEFEFKRGYNAHAPELYRFQFSATYGRYKFVLTHKNTNVQYYDCIRAVIDTTGTMSIDVHDSILANASSVWLSLLNSAFLLSNGTTLTNLDIVSLEPVLALKPTEIVISELDLKTQKDIYDLANATIGGTNLMKNSATLNNGAVIGSANPPNDGTRISRIVDDTDALSGKHVEIEYTVAGGGFWIGAYHPISSKKYSFSLEIKCSRSISINLGAEDGGILNNTVLTTSWKKISHTFIATKSGTHGAFIFSKSDFLVGDIIYIRDFKIENGDKATDWSPNPTDLVSKNEYAPDKKKLDDINAIIHGGNVEAGYNKAFRTQAVGKELAGANVDFIKVARSYTNDLPGAPAYSSGLAFGRFDTNGWLCCGKETPEVWAGGGTKEDLNWIKQLAFNDPMTGATTAIAGKVGLVPAPSAGAATRYLRCDGTWQVPPVTSYTHPTTSGNKHIPAGGASGQVLKWSADGTAVWSTDNNTTYGAATASATGLMSAADKGKLDGVATGATKSPISNSVAVTATGTYALDAVQANASVSGTLANQIAAQNTNLINKIYPLGSIYMSVNNVSPTMFIGGTWEPLKDRFLLGAGGSYNVHSTGGESSHVLKSEEMPPHQHNTTHGFRDSSFGAGGIGNGLVVTQALDNFVLLNAPVGGGNAHNNMPPYLAVYMWKRTA